MALVIDINSLTPGLTRREVAAKAGLAKAGARGRMSTDANRMLDKLAADGYKFAEVAAPTTAVKAVVNQKDIDLPSFHKWEDSKGYERSPKRIPNARLNEYVTENPDFVKREVYAAVDKPSQAKVELKPLPAYDVKEARKWAIDNGIEVPDRGRFPRWIAERFIAAHAEAGTTVPVNEPDATNNYGPTIERINPENWWEATDLDGTKIRKSWRDVSADGQNSIGFQPRPVYAWSSVDTDEMIELEPVRA